MVPEKFAKGEQRCVAGADAPRQIGKASASGASGASGAWSPAVDAARQPSRDVLVEAAANGNIRGHTTFQHCAF